MAVPAEPLPDAMPRSRADVLGLPALALAIAWSAVVAFGGGTACGWCINQFGWPGAISLAFCGAFAGYVSRKITQRPCKLSAVSQVIGVLLAYFVAETCWLHWNTRNGDASWLAALSLWPTFIREYIRPALIGVACAAYGAWWAYSYAIATRPSLPTPAAPNLPPP